MSDDDLRKLVIEFVQAVLKHNVTEAKEDELMCEDLWFKLATFVQEECE